MIADAESRRWWAWRLLAAAIIAALFFARKPHALLNAQFWAEDILIFFDQAWRLGGAAILEPYGGYLHLVPRLVAAVGAMLDPAFVPLLYNGASGAIATAVLISLVSPRTGPLWVGLSLAVVPVLLPHSGEVFLNLTNVQWFMSLLLFGALIKTSPRARSVAVFEALVIALACLTGPFCVLLLPAFAWRAWREGGAYAYLMFGVVTLGAAVQLWFLLHAPPSTPANVGIDWANSLRVVADRLGVQTFFAGGLRLADASAIALLVSLLALAIVAVSGAGEQRPARVVLLLFPVIMLGLIVVRFRELLALFASYENGDRYFFLARVCLCWMCILAAADAFTPGRRLAWLLVPALSIVAALVANFQFQPWSDLHWSRQAAIIRRGQPAKIPIQPEPWTYDFPGRVNAGANGSKP